MSYILDALKRAEAERNAGSRPSIHTPPAFTPAPQSAPPLWRSPWPWAAGAGALALAAAAAWWRIGYEQPARAAPAVTAQASQAVGKTPAPAPAATGPQPTASPQTERPGMPLAPAANTARPAREETKEQADAPPGPAAGAGRKAGRRRAMDEGAETAKKGERNEGSAHAARDASEVPAATLHDLPDNVRSQIPAYTVGGYLYSGTAADRSVLINNRLLREGSEIAPGLRIERMMPNGMVLNYQGYRYQTSY